MIAPPPDAVFDVLAYGFVMQMAQEEAYGLPSTTMTTSVYGCRKPREGRLDCKWRVKLIIAAVGEPGYESWDAHAGEHYATFEGSIRYLNGKATMQAYDDTARRRSLP